MKMNVFHLSLYNFPYKEDILMSKYNRSHPQYEEAVDSDLYAFGEPSDYLAFVKSEFATPQEYLRVEKIKQVGLEQCALLEQERLRQESLIQQYEDFFSMNIFSDRDEFCKFVEDFYGKNWTSNHPSKTFSGDAQRLYALQDLALCECHDTSDSCKNNVYEKELYLNGEIGEDVEYSMLFSDEDTNEALVAHIAEKSKHEDRRARNIRATNRLVGFFHGSTEKSFVTCNAKSKSIEHHEVTNIGFICKRYQEAKKKFAEYKLFGDAVLSPLDRKRFAETIRRFKRRIQIAKHYGNFSAEAMRYLKNVSDANIVTDTHAPKKKRKKFPLHLLGYVNHHSGIHHKVHPCATKKKLTATVTPIIMVPFKPCHIVHSFVKH
jgi:hypothetical protein